ncbi:MAG: response regulator [Verrucomicrobia bacterium]|nr:response regulator [Verrucomicrobiota bacterium]
MKPPPKFIRVFLAEEDEQDEKLIAQMLGECGGGQFILSGVFRRLDEAVCGLETGGGVDVILLDLSLPDSQGLETYSSVSRAVPEQPVIILTGYEDERVAIEAVRLGAQDYLVKYEMTGKALVRSIHCAIERKQAELEARGVRENLEKQVGELTHALSQVNARLSEVLDELSAAQYMAAQQERLHAMERMAGGIAHDFNNALSPILAYSEWLLRKTGALGDETGLRKALHNIHDAAGHCAEVVTQLREFCRSREEFDPYAPLDLGEVVQQVINLTRPSWKDQAQTRGCDIVMEMHLSETPKIQGAREDLVELFTNLILNSADSIQEKGVISATVSSQDGRVLVSIADNGQGRKEANDQSMEPLFAPKTDGEIGKDLGFGMMYVIAQRHNAQITIESEEGGGTKVIVDFPALVTPKPAKPEKPEEAAPAEPIKRLRVLAVEDEPGIRVILGIYLAEDGHKVELAADGAEALSKFEKGRFDLLLTDYSMPGMSGDRLAAAVRASDPKIRIALLTGFGSQMPQGAPLRLEVDAIIPKPFTLKSLQQGIAEAMEGGK